VFSRPFHLIYQPFEYLPRAAVHSLAPIHTGEHKIRLYLNTHSDVVGKPEGKVQFGRLGCRMEYDRQCTYNVTLMRVRAAIVAVEKV